MYTTYHLNSAQDLNLDIIESIKIAFKSRPITIVVEEDEQDELSDEIKSILDDRLKMDDKEFILVEESLTLLNKKYGLQP